MVGGQKGPAPLNLSRTSCKDETWYSYTLSKEDQKKNMNHVTRYLSSANISTFSSEIENFAIS